MEQVGLLRKLSYTVKKSVLFIPPVTTFGSNGPYRLQRRTFKVSLAPLQLHSVIRMSIQVCALKFLDRHLATRHRPHRIDGVASVLDSFPFKPQHTSTMPVFT